LDVLPEARLAALLGHPAEVLDPERGLHEAPSVDTGGHRHEVESLRREALPGREREQPVDP
jgi:hypothetical protein